MTDKELLSYSKQIVDVKSEIEDSETAKPDLEDQIRTKFTEDSINRAKFIESTLVIGAATKEFRNIFGIDAPHYEIDKDCYYAIDENNDEKYTISDSNPKIDERVILHDPMQNNVDVKTFTDCWQMIDAARFDSTSKIQHNGNSGDTVPVDRQHFFVDSKKSDTGSSVHQPICPPGYDKWAGSKIYEYICKNFDLTEPTLYKILSNPAENTLPRNLVLGPFHGDQQFSYNIDENGKTTKEIFQYNYANDSKILDCINNNNSRLNQDGCNPSINEPIKWYETLVSVRNTKSNGSKKLLYNYSWKGTPFEKSRTPMASFAIRNNFGNIINSGFVILCLDPKQLAELPREGDDFKFFKKVRYCVHMIYKENNTMYAGDDYDKEHSFLWWSWTTRVEKNYYITLNPITSLSAKVKEKFASFISNMEKDSIQYYEYAQERKIKNDIPDWNNSLSLMKALRNAANNYIASPGNDMWKMLLTALRNRVAYDIYLGVDEFSDTKSYEICDPVLYNDEIYYRKSAGSGSWNDNDWDKVFSSGDTVVSYDATLEFEKQSNYITDWYHDWIPGWPKWLRRLFKNVSTPVYTSYDRIVVNSSEEVRNIDYLTKSTYITESKSYLGPSGGDLTKFFARSNITTRKNLVNRILSENDKAILTEKEIIKGDTILINGVYQPIDYTKIEVIYNKTVTEIPPYNNVARAQKINTFLSSNPNLYDNAFKTLSDRINKRTGTLRNLCVLLESVNINAQMIEQRKANVAKLFTFMNAYEITGGFDSNIITIKLAGWEPSSSAYSNLSRLSTIYLVSDLTQTVHEESFGNITVITDKFKKGTYVKTVITDIVDLVSDVKYSYEIISGDDLSKTNKEIAEGEYYVYDDQTSKHIRITDESEVPGNKNNIYKRSGISSGPIFNVTLQDKLPASYKGRNPILVKVY